MSATQTVGKFKNSPMDLLTTLTIIAKKPIRLTTKAPPSWEGATCKLAVTSPPGCSARCLAKLCLV
jgi:hypothetical protein